jgi:superfamily I DNA/RNA helicase
MNAHINYDLPQALLAVITDEQFDDVALLARRESDHRAIDDVLASLVAAEDDELARISGPGSLLDRLLRPLNRLGTQRFLREAREKVWANAVVLNRARRQGPDTYAAVLEQLAELSAAKVAALQAPGQVLLKLATTGFGVQLPG